MKKRLAVLALAGAMAVTSLTGCGSSELADSEVALTVNGDEVTADIANFYARYTQAQYETYYLAYYGEDMWGSVKDEASYQNAVKETTADALADMLLMEDHMAEYGVEFTDEDKALVDKAVAGFTEVNSAEALEKVSGSDAAVERLLTLLTIQVKMTNEIYKTADLEVSDEEAAQMKMEYVVFPFEETDEEGTTRNLTDDEMKALKEEADSFAEGAKGEVDFKAFATESGEEALEATFDAEETQTLPVELVEAASALKEGETTGLVEGPNGYYVARLVSEFDVEATEAEKEAILAERKTAKLDEVLAAWREEAEIKVNESVWKKIDFDAMSISMSVDETEAYADEVVTDDVAEAQGN